MSHYCNSSRLLPPCCSSTCVRPVCTLSKCGAHRSRHLPRRTRAAAASAKGGEPGVSRGIGSSVSCQRSGNQRPCPASVVVVQGRVRLVIVEEIPVARLVVNSVEDRPEVESGVCVGYFERNGHGRQWVAQAERPAAGPGTRLGTTDKNRVLSAGTVYRWQRRSTPQEVDLHQVHRASQEVRSLVQILSPVIAGTLVYRAQ